MTTFGQLYLQFAEHILQLKEQTLEVGFFVKRAYLIWKPQSAHLSSNRLKDKTEQFIETFYTVTPSAHGPKMRVRYP
jgi:hypothetical protein